MDYALKEDRVYGHLIFWLNCGEDFCMCCIEANASLVDR